MINFLISSAVLLGIAAALHLTIYRRRSGR